MFNLKKIINLKFFLLALVIYILSYCYFSIQGRYYEIDLQDGRSFAIWSPKELIIYQKTRNNKTILHDSSLTIPYIPLLLLDRHFIHKTKLTVSVKGDEKRIRKLTPDGKFFINPNK